MADKKKKVKKPVIGYGANVKAGKKATKKIVGKVYKNVYGGPVKSAHVGEYTYGELRKNKVLPSGKKAKKK